MPSYNKVIIMGNVTRDPDLKRLDSGTSVCDIGVAINESWKDKEGNPREQTTFVDVVAWARQAETCAEYLRKGSPVLIDGRLQLDEWEKDGEKRSKMRVRADRVQFLGGKSSDNGPAKDESGKDSGVDEMPF
mgnify:FL=1